jgi:hypothetical protein
MRGEICAPASHRDPNVYPRDKPTKEEASFQYIWSCYARCIAGVGGLYRDRPDWLVWTVTTEARGHNPGTFFGYLQMSYRIDENAPTEAQCICWLNRMKRGLAVCPDSPESFVDCDIVRTDINSAIKALYKNGDKVQYLGNPETGKDIMSSVDSTTSVGGLVESRVCIGECPIVCYNEKCRDKKRRRVPRPYVYDIPGDFDSADVYPEWCERYDSRGEPIVATQRKRFIVTERTEVGPAETTIDVRCVDKLVSGKDTYEVDPTPDAKAIGVSRITVGESVFRKVATTAQEPASVAQRSSVACDAEPCAQSTFVTTRQDIGDTESVITTTRSTKIGQMGPDGRIEIAGIKYKAVGNSFPATPGKFCSDTILGCHAPEWFDTQEAEAAYMAEFGSKEKADIALRLARALVRGEPITAVMGFEYDRIMEDDRKMDTSADKST